MIAWTIQAAKKTKIFDQIIISTDSEKVISKMSKYNVNCIIRPKKLSEEKYGIDEVMRFSILKLGYKIDYACCLFPCAPLMTSSDIIKGYNKIKKNKHKYIFASSDFSHPIERSFKIKNKKIKMLFSEKLMEKSSKFFSKTFHDTGYFYWAKSSTWKKDNFVYNSRASIIKIPNWRAQDIDTMEDLKKANLIFKSLKKI